MDSNKYIELYNGHRMPSIGLGSMMILPEEATGVIENAIDVGYRHIDNAWLYQNEQEVGAAIKNKINQGVVKREELFIVSKLWNIFHDPADVRSSLLETLKNLQLDYIDMYYMHTPMAYEKMSIDGYQETEMSFGPESRSQYVILPRYKKTNKPICSDIDYMDTWKAMEKLVQEGLVRNIGVSNFNKYQIERVIREGSIKPACLQVEVHPYFNQKEMVDFCHQKEIAVTAYSPFSSPNREMKPKDTINVTEDPVLVEIAEKLQKTPHQIILKYLNQRKIAAIPKSSSKRNLKSNIEIYNFEIDEENMQKINRINKNWRAIDFLWDLGHKYFPFEENYKE